MVELGVASMSVTLTELVNRPPTGEIVGVARKRLLPKIESAYCVPTNTFPFTAMGAVILIPPLRISRFGFWLLL